MKMKFTDIEILSLVFRSVMTFQKRIFLSKIATVVQTLNISWGSTATNVQFYSSETNRA